MPVKICCPRCLVVNRTPEARLEDGPICGRCGGLLLSGTPITADARLLGKLAEIDDLPCVVDFWAPWCGPCVEMAPRLAELAATHSTRCRVLKVDIDANPNSASKYNIRSVPTLIIIKHDAIVSRQSGAMDATSLRRWVDQTV